MAVDFGLVATWLVVCNQEELACCENFWKGKLSTDATSLINV